MVFKIFIPVILILVNCYLNPVFRELVDPDKSDGDNWLFLLFYSGNSSLTGQTQDSDSSIFTVSISPPAGRYTSPISMTLTSSIPNSKIFYTLDGSEPNEFSEEYLNPIHIWSITGLDIRYKAISSDQISTETFNLGGVYQYPPINTGQTIQYRNGDDGNLRRGVARNYTGPTQNSIYTSDFTTRDNSTGLVWRSCSQGQNGASCSGEALGMNWQNAQTGPSGCNALNEFNDGQGYAGINEWRLPSRIEMETLIDYGREISPLISQSSFPETQSSNYWTSTSSALNASTA